MNRFRASRERALRAEPQHAGNGKQRLPEVTAQHTPQCNLLFGCWLHRCFLRATVFRAVPAAQDSWRQRDVGPALIADHEHHVHVRTAGDRVRHDFSRHFNALLAAGKLAFLPGVHDIQAVGRVIQVGSRAANAEPWFFCKCRSGIYGKVNFPLTMVCAEPIGSAAMATTPNDASPSAMISRKILVFI